ncbi:hypothetical protein BDF22DRAFT_743362 [Syncephalis plumigaleata]|nr:hypothetical protein BDF22DRAFT_743362 [Syncephalis plumigaleata]
MCLGGGRKPEIPTVSKLDGEHIINDDGIYARVYHPIDVRRKGLVNVVCNSKNGVPFGPFKVMNYIDSNSDTMSKELKSSYPTIDARFYYDGRACYVLANSCSVAIAKILSVSDKLDQVKKINLLRQVVNGMKTVVITHEVSLMIVTPFLAFFYMKEQGFYLHKSFSKLCYTKEGNMAFGLVTHALSKDIYKHNKFGAITYKDFAEVENTIFLYRFGNFYKDLFGATSDVKAFTKSLDNLLMPMNPSAPAPMSQPSLARPVQGK